VQPLQT